MPKLAYDLEIYTYQIDAAQHVSNIVYIQWMEIGRLELLKAMERPYHHVARDGFFPVLVETNIKYLKPFFLGDEVRGHVWVTELARATAWLEFSFSDGNGEIRATGRQRGVFIDAKTGRPKRLTEAEKEMFERFLEA